MSAIGTFRRARGGDRGKWLEETYRAYRDKVFGTVYHVVGNVEDSEDVTEDVFARLCEHPESYDPAGGDLAGWLYRVAHNAAISFVRRRRTHDTRMPVEDVDPDLVPGGEDPAVELARRECRERVDRALAVLPVEQRAALLLRFEYRLSHVQAAVVLGCCESWERALVHHALLALRRGLGVTAGSR